VVGLGLVARRRGLARYAAPCAFLLAATVAVLLVRSGLGRDSSAPSPAPATSPAGSRRQSDRAKASRARLYLVRSGDTLAQIALDEGTTVARLLRLNPAIDPRALRPGQTIRVR
jgi:hypothetical protein